jgi:hypothetical protein
VIYDDSPCPFERSVCKKEEKMKPIKYGIILLALLLAAMAMVPMVSAMGTAITPDVATAIESNYVSPDTAFQSATAAVKDFIGRNALDENWNGATVNPKPNIIFDVNGKKLFYLFSVEKKGNRIGEIKIAASKVLGSSVVTIGSGAPAIDLKNIRSKATGILNQQYKNAKIDSIDLVCYNYPNIGAIIRFTAAGSGSTSLVIDAYDYSIIPAAGQVSFYNAIPPADLAGRAARWDSEQTALKTVSAQSLSPMATVTKTINGFTLYPQESTNWCSFATAKMISAYYGYSRTQRGIATTMGIANPDDGASIETTRSNYYLNTIANGGLAKMGTSISYTGMFTYDNIVSEMNSNRPIHTDRYETSSYHARAITGYSYTTTTPVSQYLYIYDPWPTTSGAVYWENWNVFSGQPNPVHAILYVRN